MQERVREGDAQNYQIGRQNVISVSLFYIIGRIITVSHMEIQCNFKDNQSHFL